jgi:predicted lipoprotein
MKTRILATITFILALGLLCTGCNLITIVPLDMNATEQTFYQEVVDSDFDADVYAAEQWTAITSFASKNSNPIDAIMELLQIDPDACGEKYGTRPDANSLWQFITNGDAVVLMVNRDSQVGLLELDLPPYDGVADCYLQIGPVIKGQAIRDSIQFISFKDFVNQLQFGDVAKALNTYSYNNVISAIDIDGLQGKTISFKGAFTAEPGKNVQIVPIILSVNEG